MKPIILFCVAMSMTFLTSGQQKLPPDHLHFHSLNLFGLLEGQSGSSFQLQTINGVQYKSWFAGAGVGIDYYRYRTIPLFLDIRKEFLPGANKLFIYADAGISFSWVTDHQKSEYQFGQFKNGFYNDFGLGYKMKMGKTSSFLLSAGYSFKKIVVSQTNDYNFYPPGLYGHQDQSINYSLNRVIIKLGFSF